MKSKDLINRMIPWRVKVALSTLKNGLPPAWALPYRSLHVPTMIVEAEADYFANCTRRFFGRQGGIVDLGCWMGSTSIALARGLVQANTRNPSHREKVLAYDRFVWEEWMMMYETFGIYQPGDVFLPEARRVVNEHGNGLIELIQADLSCFEWSGDSIKILLVDAMKSAGLARQIARTFYPSLQIGGIVIQQDFKHFYTSWIHVLHFRLQKYFRMIHRVPRGGSVAFEAMAPISTSDVTQATDFENISDVESEECFRYSMGLVETDEKFKVAAAHVSLYYHLNRIDKARELIDRYAALGMAENWEFQSAIRLFEDQTCQKL
jgi:hypothetical protein